MADNEDQRAAEKAAQKKADADALEAAEQDYPEGKDTLVYSRDKGGDVVFKQVTAKAAEKMVKAKEAAYSPADVPGKSK